MINVMTIFGTRPEAIKLAPVILELQSKNSINSIVCVTGQHRQMLDQVLTTFNIVPDYDLEIMSTNQTLVTITSAALIKLNEVIKEVKPDIILVHGDTTTTFVASLAAFYNQVRIGHIEAGLRTYDKYSPFPEECNRQMVSTLADLHFAPTKVSKQNLLKENINPDSIYITGNTAIDALRSTINPQFEHPLLSKIGDDRILLLTAHRRENLGEPLEAIFLAVKKIVDEFDDIQVVFPVHMNPRVRVIADKILSQHPKIHLIEPLEVVEFHNFLNKSYLVLTDSGGIQEEAPSLGKPVLVLRDTTERPEGVDVGTLKLVGTNETSVYNAASELLKNKVAYDKMAKATNPYGDGTASKKIVETILMTFNK